MKRHVLRTARLACAAWLVAGVAQADKMTDAEELFRRAKTLMSQNKHIDACPLLEESERLDPQMGTLLNLAICHEKIGKIASAWGEFRAVEQQARAANREDRVKLAHERAVKLEPRLPRIKVVVPENTAGLVVKVDGEAKGEALWSGVAVDPGTRTVEASAPGKKTVRLTAKVNEEGAVVPVTIPALEDEPVAVVGPVVDPNAGDEEQYAANRSRRTTGFVVGGIGVTTAAVGGVFGVLAILANKDAPKACPKPCIAGSNAAKAADTSTDRALLFANVANVVIPIGAIAAAIGGYMILSAGPTEKPRAYVSPRFGGVDFGVSF